MAHMNEPGNLVSNLEKYKTMQFFSMEEDKNQEDRKLLINFFLIENIVNFLTEKVGTNILPMSYNCHYCSL